MPDGRWGEAVVAVVVPADGTQRDGDELVRYAREQVAHFKCPRRVEFVDELPRTATGKVFKRELRQRYAGSTVTVHR